MSGSARKRSSKWDLKDDPHISTAVGQDGAWSGRSGDILKSKHDMALSYREPFPRSRGHGEFNRDSRDINPWDKDRDVSMKMSPSLEDTRLWNPSHSPRNDWRRSLRKRSRSRSRSRSYSRSRSWSRSRSRSRSPVHKFMRDSKTYDVGRGRSGLSAKICRDFAAGRCRRGSDCHFLHQANQIYEHSLESRQKEDKAFRYSTSRHMGNHHTRSGRSAEICNNFLKGACRRGSSCKYIHASTSNESGQGSADEVFRETETKRRNRDRSFERLGERGPHGNASVPCRYFAAGNCRNDKNCRFSHGHLAASPDRKAHNYDWECSRNSDNANNMWNGPKWVDINSGSDAAILNENRDKKITGQVHDVSRWSMDKRISPNSNSEIKTLPNPVVTSETVGGGEVASSQVEPGKNGVTLNLSEPRGAEELPGETAMSPVWNFSVQSSSHFQKEEHKPNTENTVAQVRHDTLLAQDTISSEQLKQISNLSASLAQLIANGQQLPQIYASLNSQSPKDMLSFAHSGGPVEPVSSASIQPHPPSGSGKQCEPVSSNIDLKQPDSSNLPTGFPHRTIGHKSSALADANHVPGESNSVLLSGAPDGNDIYPIGNLESNNGTSHLNQPQPCTNLNTVGRNEVIRTGENKNTQDENNIKADGPVEDVARDDKAEECKKSKDTKELRAFKFALVELVKELMKPAWKEGQIDKEDYKTIVKKVVDKITSTFQGTSVPQTKEKIDHYLSFAKPKITKLVQAYVEKYHKSKTK